MIPRDPAILFSWLNTKLRDEYPSLEALCEDLEAPREEIERTMAKVGYSYDPGRNAFG